MSSWFNDLTAQVGDLTNKVQAAIPIDKEMMQKLTLTTPELTAERQRIDEEEKRKEFVKDSLAGMLPWETRDAEREILVEECKEAILLLSTKNDTFLGPYKMPALPKTSDDDDDDEEEEELIVPSEESLEKLSKLEPLPPLLADFDLDSHVGLIQRLLKVDNNLVEQQSKLSGAGDRERTFWRNYFFHCAFTRYEAGLSIDEIWSDRPPTLSDLSAHVDDDEDAAPEETITFESPKKMNEQDASATQEPLFDTKPQEEPRTQGATASQSSGGSNEGADYEMVSGTDGDAADLELDELEAEIARELED
jgi:hypothetical protein